MARKEYRGAAETLTLLTNITNSALTIYSAETPSGGWPTGSGGKNFVVTIDRGRPTEEKLLCSGRTGTTFTVVTRGFDGTVASDHDAGAELEHTIDAATLDDLWDAIEGNDTDIATNATAITDITSGATDLTSYLKTDGSRALTGDQSAGGNKITSLGEPTANTDAATKSYVDSAITAGAVTLYDVVSVFLPGSLQATTQDVLFPYDQFRLLRLRAWSGETPSGTSGSNHFKVALSDGTTTAEVPVDSDVQSHEGDIISYLNRMGGGDVNGTALTTNVAVRFTPTSEFTCDTVRFETHDSSGSVTATAYILDDSKNILVQSSAQSVSIYQDGTEYFIQAAFGQDYTFQSGVTYYVWFSHDLTNITYKRGNGQSYSAYGCTYLGADRVGITSAASIDVDPNEQLNWDIRESTYPEYTNLSGKVATLTASEVGTAPANPGGDVTIEMLVEEI